MLNRQHTRRKSIRVIPVQNGDSSLRDDRTHIHFSGDKVHRRPMNAYALGERPLMGMQSREAWQQSRVDVDHPALPLVHEPRCQQTQKASQNKQLYIVLFQHGVQITLKRLTVLAIKLVIQRKRRKALVSSPFQTFCVRSVGANHNDFRRIIRGFCCLNKRQHVGATP